MLEVCYMVCYFRLGNDCAYTVGMHIGGTIENFGKLMTKKAKEIGALNSNFTNPHGLDAQEHYSTAKDLAIITRYALNNEYIANVMKTKSETINFGSFSKLLTNTNALLRTYSYATGGKTGFTNGANRCLIATAEKNSKKFIAVVLGAETTEKRFGEAKKILEESFNRYDQRDISKNLNFYIKIPLFKSFNKYYEQTINKQMIVPLTDEEYENIVVEQDIIKNIQAPMNKGTKIGNLKVRIENEILYEQNVILTEDIKKMQIKDYMLDAIKNMFVERINI